MDGTTAARAAGRLDVMVHSVHGAFLRDLGQLPPPLRLLYRTVWRRRYLHGPHWQTGSTSPMAGTDRTNGISEVAL